MPNVTPQTWIHLVSIIPALGLGLSQLLLAKGTDSHRIMGRLWAGLMLVASLSSFWIQRHGLSWIHGLSTITIVSVCMGVYHARHGRAGPHSRYMLGAFLGSLGAGLGALAPGRLMHIVMFGP